MREGEEKRGEESAWKRLERRVRESGKGERGWEERMEEVREERGR